MTANTATSSLKEIGTFKKAGLEFFSSNKYSNLQIFLNQPQSTWDNDCRQLLLWNKHSQVQWQYHKKDGFLQLIL